MGTSIVSTKCSKCDNVIVINKRWTTGGINDYGSFLVECKKCANQFEIPIGKDVYDSSIQSGAILIKIIERD